MEPPETAAPGQLPGWAQDPLDFIRVLTKLAYRIFYGSEVPGKQAGVSAEEIPQLL